MTAAVAALFPCSLNGPAACGCERRLHGRAGADGARQPVAWSATTAPAGARN